MLIFYKEDEVLFYHREDEVLICHRKACLAPIQLLSIRRLELTRTVLAASLNNGAVCKLDA